MNTDDILYLVIAGVIILLALWGLVSIIIQRIQYDDVLEYLDDEENI